MDDIHFTPEPELNTDNHFESVDGRGSKNFFMWAGIIIALLLLIFFGGRAGLRKINENKKNKMEQTARNKKAEERKLFVDDSLKTVSAAKQKAAEAKKIAEAKRAEEEKAAEQQTIANKLTLLEKKVKSLEAAAAAAKKNAASASSNTKTGATKEPTTAKTGLTNPGAFKPGEKESQTYKTKLDGTKYSGIKDGDFFVTISENSFLQYCFSEKLFKDAGGKGTPELNEKGSGKKFELKDGIYSYTDSTILTVESLGNTYSWAVFIGDKSGYSAYLPNETIKPEIMQVMGKLSGTISQETLDKIGELVPEVKSARIQPNKVTGKGAYDGLVYEGWCFKTKVMYKKN